MEKLKKLRERIDWLDSQIASLLNERMRATDQVGRIKRDNHIVVTDQSREQIVLNRVEEMVQHPVLKANIANIYHEIMQESKIAQQFFQSLSLPFRKIGIIGLGLMGGSICKGIKLKDAGVEISTVRHPCEDCQLAKEGGWIDREYETLKELIADVELLILATPLSSVLALSEEIKALAPKSKRLLVIDIASAKAEVAKGFEKLTSDHVEYIATHPMAGREKNGFAHSQATLFVNRPWIIVPHQHNRDENLEKIQTLAKYLGSAPLLLDGSTHDRRAALISHLPSLLSKWYLDFVLAIDPEAIHMAGPGFQSYTRLGHEQKARREELLQHNQSAIHAILDQWIDMVIKKRGAK